ncbi:putative SbcD/Mre11-related phosphoesterase [Halarchaeum rubridurum]|uniref:Phosphoesterase n=1 Tax=Halarchaeum rubridurum TaxID=489911 RepID=A0A830FMH8_9EURY|nr:metallophosphoesterase [Halarchaeum rubridurum]MBP1953514.1 putative SbcD/Mre11-related phosphoesterase [Halarchaeum rubridurum]GGM64642.1 phosphoesterase [Halarchaeum rubridurum]
MARVEPVPGRPAAVADCGDESALVVADYHAGIEASLRREGLEAPSRADERRERVLSLVVETGAERVVFLGDLGHRIGAPRGAELDELETLVAELPVPVTLVRGNHDGGLADVLDVEVTPAEGVRLGDVGFCHGHTWPSRAVLDAGVVCVGHEHPAVKLSDEVGGGRVERVWLRGPLVADPFVAREVETNGDLSGELVVCPAFNDYSGGTWVNVEGQGFLAPFLPEACPDAQAYLLDGTRLGPYRGL